MAASRFKKSLPAFVLILLGLTLAVGLALWLFRPGPSHRLTYRIGYGEDRPYHFTGSDGRPTGLAVDIVQEAAQRRGIHLDWVETSGQAIPLLQSGKLDLWVLLSIRPERKGQVYFSEPYLIAETCFLVPQASPVQSVRDLSGLRISLVNFDVNVRNVAAVVPNARQVPVDTIADVLTAVNDGRADAAYVDQYSGGAALLSGSGGKPLRLIGPTVPRFFMALGSTFPVAGIADEIRDEMKAMAHDGSLAKLIQRWEFFTFTDAVAYIESESRANRLMAIGLIGLTVLALLIALMAYRLRRERNAVEEHLARRAQAELEQQSLERQLQQARRMESVGRLAGGVAHDFNNLLTVINGYTDIVLRRMGAEEPWRNQLENVRMAGARAADLTRQLLAFSRKQVLQPKVMLLNDLVRETEGMLRRIIGEDIHVVTSIDPVLRLVEADPGQIQQVILNLALNARDAMPAGGRLTIETANGKPEEFCANCREDARGGFVALTVSDTGTGMDAATVEQAFEPFFTTKSVGKGTGLGLSTVYGIVKQSGGHISIASEPGRGTKVTIHLPAVEKLAESDRVLPEPAAGGTETLLLVEDEETVRRLIGAILSARGYRTLQASDGKEAIAVYERQNGRIDLLISDVLLPGMRGMEVAEALRRRDPELRVLFISGYTDLNISATAVFQSGAEFLQKPFEPEELLRKVRQALGGSGKPGPDTIRPAG